MIIQFLFNIILTLLKTIFSVLPDLPQLPSALLASVNTVMTVIFDNIKLLGFFFPISTIKIMVPLILIVINFDKIYHFTLWVVKKLPIGVKQKIRLKEQPPNQGLGANFVLLKKILKSWGVSEAYCYKNSKFKE